MANTDIHSDVFRKAELQSERLRIFAMKSSRSSIKLWSISPTVRSSRTI